MSLVNWAKNELDRLLVDDEDGMQKEVNESIIEVVEVFSKQGHSGFSASYALEMISRLLSWKPITSLTGDESEWNDVSDYCDGRSVQQNNRCSAVFRDNNDNTSAHYVDGKVFSDDGGVSWFTRGGGDSSVPVTFPFHVPDKPEYIMLEDAELELPQAIGTNESA